MYTNYKDMKCDRHRKIDKNSSEDEIANVKVLQQHRTCRGQGLHPLN